MAGVTIECTEKNKLVAIRDIQRRQIEDYFKKNIRDQVLTYSDDETIVNAMHDF